MKALMNYEEFVSALKKADRGVLQASMNGLNGYYLSFCKGKPSMVLGTSFEVTVRAYFDAEVDEDFDLFVSKDLMSVAYMFAENIEIEKKSKTKIVIKSGRSKLQIPVLGEELPKYKTAEGNSETVFHIGSISRQVKDVLHALGSSNGGNSLMSSVYLEFLSEDKVRVTALDGYRISIRGKEDQKAEAAEMIQGSSMKIVADLMKGDVKASLGDHMVTFSDEHTVIDCLTTPGSYFKINKMFQTPINQRITMNREELLNALTLANVVDERVVFDYEEKEQAMRFKTKAQKGATDTLVAADMDGTGFKKTGCNIKYLMEALKSIPDETFVLEAISPVSPLIIRGEEYAELVLPVKVLE